MPLQETSGSASYDAFGGGAAERVFIEDVFSTWLYQQNTSGQGIPLVTGVGFVSTDAWKSNVMLTTADTSSACAFDANGNYYVAMSDISSGGYVAKFSSAGTKTWLIKLSPTAQYLIPYSIKVTSAGDVYVAGMRANENAAFICKLNSSGSVSWTRELVVQGSSWVGMDIDSSENVHLVYTEGSTFYGGYAKFNSSGTQDTSASKRFYSATQTYPRSITVDSSGNIYVSGFYYNSAVTRYYGFVIKFNSSMAVQWNRALYNTAAETSFNGVSVDSSGNVYVTGKIRATNNVIITAKYDSSGTLQWQKQLSRSGTSIEGYAIKTDSSGNSYVSGYGVSGSWQIQAVDTSGNSLWQKAFLLTTSVNNPIGYSIDINSSNVLVSGPSNETTSTSTNRTQIVRMGISGASNGVTTYGTLATSSLTFGNAAGVAQTQTFTVTTGNTFSTVTYTSASNSLSESLISIAAATSTGGLCWLKNRSAAANNILALSETSYIFSNLSDAASSSIQYIKALSSNGVLIPSDSATTNNFVSWNFRKQPKFFDVVTYTGTGANRTIAHNLGAVPGCIIIKTTSAGAAADWVVYHRSLANTQILSLNQTFAAFTGATYWNSTTPTSTVFSLGTNLDVNANGISYVAYLFAHDAGGFGLTGTDNVISCGSYTGNGSATGPVITLGYEPQWLMIKNATSSGNWLMLDNMRGMPVGSVDANLQANLSNAESSAVDFVSPTSTGFQVVTTDSNANTNAATYIYIAIRRGPMKVPTSGTSVFVPSTRTGTGASGSSTALGEVTDLVVTKSRGSTYVEWAWTDRLRGPTKELTSVLQQAETTFANDVTSFASMTGFDFGTGASGRINTSSVNYIDYLFKRAPGFMDIVCYSGTGTTMNVPHNLGVVPRLIITKARNSGSYSWYVMPITAFSGSNNFYMILNSTSVRNSDFGQWGTQNPTATTFRVGGGYDSNQSGVTYVAYLFSDVLGVSKIALYTGNGSSQTINCGFTAGARFVLIKSIDSNGGAIAQTGWYVWDSARGIVSGNDPYLALNDGSGEVTTDDSIDTDSTGFIVNQLTATNINVNGRGYIYLAIA